MVVTFDVSPEKEGSLLNYFYRQIFERPAEVRGVDLGGKTAIVTGSNTGIGRECSRQLLDLGLSKLILAVRNVAKGQAAAAELSKGRHLKEGAIEVWELDYSSYDSIRSFVERTKTLERLHIVILNSAIITTEINHNPNTGHEDIIQINYISAALLIILLLPVVKAKRVPTEPPCRITLVSSDTAAWAKLGDVDEGSILSSLDEHRKGLTGFNRVCISKLLGQLFLVELAKRVSSPAAVVNTATPMMVYDSDFSRQTVTTFLGRIAELFRRLIGYTSAVGARMVVDAAVRHGDETHGQYLGLHKLKPMAPIVYTPKGKRLAATLWKETLQEFSFAGVENILKEVNGRYE
ncbi:NAD(P)-binding protein [Daldinia eschscholtzii]|nr:NAD(P)-binding protein [Daldinia eschscholtzii]